MSRGAVRKWGFPLLAAALLSGWCMASAQNPLEDAIQQLNSQNVRGYLQPFVNSVGANFNSGFYHSADLSDAIRVQFQVIAMGTLIGPTEKSYLGTAPKGYSQNPVQTATLFGGDGATVPGLAPGMSYHFQNGQVNTQVVPFAVPQMTIGNFFGTQAVIRYAPVPAISNMPKITLAGGGLRHSLSRYLPMVPLDLSAGVFYQQLTIGDYLEEKGFAFGAQVSKTFFIATLYGGLQYESSSMSVHYTYQGPDATPNTVIGLSIDGENSYRATAGLALDLIIMTLNADVSVGKMTVASAGFSLGL
ncbi:MAG TPA: DUF6588 family protein [Bacteroidota bacterium]|nr:DUF6588 family protein [Bacteroidota bacterium]